MLSRRWLVERTFASLRCCRRLANDIEATIASAEPGSSSRRSALCFAAWQLRLARNRVLNQVSGVPRDRLLETINGIDSIALQADGRQHQDGSAAACGGHCGNISLDHTSIPQSLQSR